MYQRRWTRRDPDTRIFHDLLGNNRIRPTILFLWDQLFEAENECDRIEEYYLAEIRKAKRRVAELENRFLKDSHNSHRPPSTDPPHKTRRTRSLRQRSGLSPGGQQGHPGHALMQVDDPDETRIHPVHRCGRCGTRLKTLPALENEVRQVIDIMNGRRWIVEHRAEMKVCSKCDSMNHGGFPPEARAYACYGPGVRRIPLYLVGYQMIPHARTCEMLSHLFGLALKPGSIHRFAVEARRGLKPWENRTKKEIIAQPVAHFDETGLRYQGELHWLHASSTAESTILVPHEKRGSEAMIEETEKRARWASRMKRLLQHALHHQHRRALRGKALRSAWIRSIERRYERILRQGYRNHGKWMPRHPRSPNTGPRQSRESGEKLLQRLHFYQEQTLAFLKHPGVPFSNNLVERDLRMVKVKQKISGSFRSYGGAKAFCRLRSFLSTALKRGRNPFAALLEILPPATPSGILVTT